MDNIAIRSLKNYLNTFLVFNAFEVLLFPSFWLEDDTAVYSMDKYH
jgi:hypothetical protein